jgi:hypothetical protein
MAKQANGRDKKRQDNKRHECALKTMAKKAKKPSNFQTWDA